MLRKIEAFCLRVKYQGDPLVILFNWNRTAGDDFIFHSWNTEKCRPKCDSMERSKDYSTDSPYSAFKAIQVAGRPCRRCFSGIEREYLEAHLNKFTEADVLALPDAIERHIMDYGKPIRQIPWESDIALRQILKNPYSFFVGCPADFVEMMSKKIISVLDLRRKGWPEKRIVRLVRYRRLRKEEDI